jgi:hypothetical protein
MLWGTHMTFFTLRAFLFFFSALTTLLLGGCMSVPGMGMPSPGGVAAAHARQIQVMGGGPDMANLLKKQQLIQDLMSNPDLPAWHDQRQKIMMAVGDRVFDKSFDEVYEGMIIALATLGSRVNNMDRTSGYITGSIPDLGPERNLQLQQESLAEYARIKGYPDSVVQSQGPRDVNLSATQGMMSRMGGSGLTLTMVRQSARQTKVKLRFDNVYYPTTEQELYRNVWTAVDKQMFLDKALDR